MKAQVGPWVLASCDIWYILLQYTSPAPGGFAGADSLHRCPRAGSLCGSDRAGMISKGFAFHACMGVCVFVCVCVF